MHGVIAHRKCCLPCGAHGTTNHKKCYYPYTSTALLPKYK